MKQPDPDRKPYLGMHRGDLDNQWYARYWNPKMAPLGGTAKEALLLGPQPWPLGLDIADAASLTAPGHHELENGFSVNRDGAVHVAVLTPMPRVSPGMWDWWFAWHSTQTQRYKLWHPRAHLYCEWSAPEASGGGSNREKYIGATSFVDEYVGSTYGELALRFLSPAELGIDTQALADPEETTAVCARVGLSRFPLDWGYFVHYIRRVKDGAEMRSRFWMGGRFVAARPEGTPLTGETKMVAEGISRMGVEQAQALLVHCSQEMSHLAQFLPDIHGEFARSETPGLW